MQSQLAALRGQGAEQRKLVTVLFADLVSFTALSETLDPEDVRELQQDYFARWRRAIEQQGGVVEKFIGDAVMALFGVPAAREDDAERAVRAALALHAGLAELNAARETALQMRVGVHTGPVLVAGGARRLRGHRRHGQRGRAAPGQCPARRHAHQPQRLPARARPVRGGCAAAAGAQGQGRAAPDLPGEPPAAGRLPRHGARRRGRGDAHGRPRGGAAGAAARLCRRRGRRGRAHRPGGGRARPGQEPPGLRVQPVAGRPIRARPAGAPGPARPRHAAVQRHARRAAARPVQPALRPL